MKKCLDKALNGFQFLGNFIANVLPWISVDSSSSLADLACFEQQTDVLFRHAAFSIRNDGFGLGHVFWGWLWW